MVCARRDRSRPDSRLERDFLDALDQLVADGRIEPVEIDWAELQAVVQNNLRETGAAVADELEAEWTLPPRVTGGCPLRETSD